jgi:hypothetical protein
MRPKNSKRGSTFVKLASDFVEARRALEHAIHNRADRLMSFWRRGGEHIENPEGMNWR